MILMVTKMEKTAAETNIEEFTPVDLMEFAEDGAWIDEVTLTDIKGLIGTYADEIRREPGYGIIAKFSKEGFNGQDPADILFDASVVSGNTCTRLSDFLHEEYMKEDAFSKPYIISENAIWS